MSSNTFLYKTPYKKYNLDLKANIKFSIDNVLKTKREGVLIILETEELRLPLWLLADRKSLVNKTRIVMEWDG